ncbi:MAG: FAD-dependent oxidoreductase [Erysipelotrichales bacterium]|nr:FAD-dependent oxidoreductase [Erysipelotrichales bacterium]MBQ2309978.1 FAD-dependent oxidoreductase [Erysipelotrichales bacterium]MBQ2478418.1 FAD-dependent oxidoreductase [Erysipelotrichales bacterium]
MDKNVRICIIGGGPAGLSAGMYLEQKGYENYTILERNDHVGGKCHSPHYNGRRYEMGAIMGVPSYYAVADVEKFCGITHDGPKLNRNYKNKEGKVIEPFNPKKNLLKIPHLMEMKKQVKKLGEILETKYKGYDVNGHRGVAQGRYDGYAVTPGREKISGENPNLKDLCMPFKDWCKLNGVELTQEIWVGPFTSFGYGYFDEIPAAYVLKYLDFQTTMNFVNINLWTWKEGTQYIWECLDAKLKNHARLNSKITKVERKDGKVYVTVNGEVEEYDKLIVTAPLQYLPDYADAREDEKELFSKIDYERYDVLAVETKPEDHPEISYYVFDNMTPERLGHLMVYYRRWRDSKDQVITTYALRKHKNSAEIPYEECKKTVLEDLKIMKNPASNIVNESSWYYFPHVFSEDYAAGWYDKVEAMQGKYDTYYAGEVMSFGDMDETAEYSRELVDRFF